MVQLLLRQVKHVNLFNQFVGHCFLQNLRNTEIPNLAEKKLAIPCKWLRAYEYTAYLQLKKYNKLKLRRTLSKLYKTQ